MHKFILLFALVLALTGVCNSAHSELLIDSYDFVDNLAYARSSVVVIGRLQGSGTLILFDGRPAILTNSHLLKGLSAASVQLPRSCPNLLPRPLELELGCYDFAPVRRLDSDPSAPEGRHESWMRIHLPFYAKAPVLFDSPADDIAILDLPSPIDEDALAFFWKMAHLNGSFCSHSAHSSCKLSTAQNFSVPGIVKWGRVNAVIDGQARSTRTLVPFPILEVADQAVSGLNNSIYLIPIYLKPGVSGGAFYLDGVLKGLITSVSSGGDAFTVAIPTTEIQRILNLPPRGHWVPVRTSSTKTQYVLEIIDGHQVLDFFPGKSFYSSAGAEPSNGGAEPSNGGAEPSNGGAEPSNGGAEPSNGGAEPSNGGASLHSKGWELIIPDKLITCMQEAPGSSQKVCTHLMNEQFTLDPFAFSDQKLLINGREVRYFESLNKKTREVLALAASPAVYFALKSSSATLQSWRPVFSSPESLDYIRKKNVPSFKFGRLYVRNEDGHYEQFNSNCDTLVGDQAEALAKAFDQMPDGGSIPRIKNCLKNKIGRHGLEENGFIKGFPFSVRTSTQNLLEVTTQNPKNRNKVHIQVAADLNTISISTESQSLQLQLQKTRSMNAWVWLPAANEGQRVVRAIGEFDAGNLNLLERLFIEDEDLLMEFISCTPGKDCFR